MEALIFFVIVLVSNSVLPLFLPWWILVPANILASFPFRLTNGIGFWLGGFGSGLVWLGASLWISGINGHILAQRLSKLFMIPHPVLLFGVEFLIPFLLGGIASLTGIHFKKFITSNAN
jgi:hypothetical protein